MASKKLTAVLLTLAMVFSLTACGKKSEETTKKKTKKTTKQEETYEDPDDPDDTEEPEYTTSDTDVSFVDDEASLDNTTITPGSIYIIPESYDGAGGMIIDSPSSGTREMSRADYRVSNIRFLFEQDDNIEIYPEMASEEQSAYLIPHHEDFSIYTEDYIKNLPAEIAGADFVDPQNPDWYWANLSLNEDTYAPGYYDLVITDMGEPAYLICLKIVGNGELSEINDSEYYSLLKKETDKTGGQEKYKIDFDKFYGCYEQGIWPDDYTWSGSGLPTLPSVSETADIEMNVIDPVLVSITSPLNGADGEEACVAIDEVFQSNGYEIEYPDGDADANYRYVRTDIDGVPAEISYYSYNDELHLTIENLVANACE